MRLEAEAPRKVVPDDQKLLPWEKKGVSQKNLSWGTPTPLPDPVVSHLVL